MKMNSMNSTVAVVVLVLARGEQAKAKLLTWTRAWLAPMLAGRVTLDAGLVLDRQQGRWPG